MICITCVFALLLSEAWSMGGTQRRVTGGDQERQAPQFRPTRELEIEDKVSEIRSQAIESSTLISEEVSLALQINETQTDSIEETEDRIDPGYKDQRKKKQLRRNMKKRKNKRMKKGKGRGVGTLKVENDPFDKKGSQKESGESFAGENENEEEPMDEGNEEEGEKANDYETEIDMPESIEVENKFAETNTVYDVTTEEMNNEMDVATNESGWWERTKNRFSSIASYFSSFLHDNL